MNVEINYSLNEYTEDIKHLTADLVSLQEHFTVTANREEVENLADALARLQIVLDGISLF